VWHASIAGPGLSRATRRRWALKALRGVGEPGAQWEEVGAVAYHVRRRLRPDEALTVGPVRDLRGTLEGHVRWEALRDELPPAVWPMAVAEVGRM